jgi:predicted nucleic acid-binding protein
MQKPQLVAVDTNILMRLADRHETTLDAWQLIQRRLRPVQILALPTVLDELASHSLCAQDPWVRAAANRALQELRGRWLCHPADVDAVTEAVAANARDKLCASGLLPAAERNDAAIIAEAAALNCILLVSRDSHLLDIDREKLTLLLRSLDLPTPLISSPESLIKKFDS